MSCKGVDLWKTDKPAYGYNGTYSGITFSAEVQRVIANHDPTKAPLFMYIALQNVCCLEVVQRCGELSTRQRLGMRFKLSAGSKAIAEKFLH